MYPIAIAAKRTTSVNAVTDLSAVVFLSGHISDCLTPMGADWLHADISG